MAEHTQETLRRFEDRPDFMGYGYLGNSFRTEDTDRYLLKAANAHGISEEDLFEWCNSKYGRWEAEGDGRGHLNLGRLMEVLPQQVEELRAYGNVGRESRRGQGTRSVFYNRDGSVHHYGEWEPETQAY